MLPLLHLVQSEEGYVSTDGIAFCAAQLGLTAAPSGVALTPLASRRRSSIACRRGTRHHPAIAAFVAAIRQPASAPAALDAPPGRAR